MKFLIVIFMVLLAIRSFAVDCSIQGGIDIPDPRYKSEQYVSLSRIVEELVQTNSAQECFTYAISTCQKLPPTAKVDISNKFNRTYNSETITFGAVYCTWQFDDGYVDDSDGLVTASTNPRDFRLGDARVLGDDQALPNEAN